MPEYTLHYFNGRGRAEICRLLFAYADTPFIDKRIDFFKWDGVKSKMPCCMLPILEINGNIQIPQSMTISRYLANEFGFNGSNNIEMANIESITDCLYDVFDNYMRMFYDRNGRKVKRFSSDMRGKYSENESESRNKYLETCNRVLPYLENCLKLQENSGQYFTGDKIKLCDLMCYSAMENPLLENPSLLNDFPKLQRLRKQVYADPKVFSYLKRRNETEF